jgi:hypothetical protein
VRKRSNAKNGCVQYKANTAKCSFSVLFTNLGLEFRITMVGMFNDYLTTVSPPCREMKFWKKTDLSLSGIYNRGTRNSLIHKGFLYETEGNTLKRVPVNTLFSL